MTKISVADHEIINIPDGFEDPSLPHRSCFSPSQYKTYKRCPKQYYYRYVLGRKSPPGIALIQGTAVHKGAEETHKATIEGKKLSLEEARSTVADSFDARKDEIEDWEENDAGAVKDKTLGSFTVYYNTAVPLINPVRVEAGFAAKLGTVPVIGFIDLIDRVPTGVTDEETGEVEAIEVVSDLKVTKKKWNDQQVRFDPQLTFYAHVEGTPRVRFDLLVASKTKTRYIPERSIRTPHDVNMLVEDLEETVDNIKRGVFPRILQTEWGCTEKWCGFYNECRGPK